MTIRSGGGTSGLQYHTGSLQNTAPRVRDMTGNTAPSSLCDGRSSREGSGCSQ